MRASIIVILCSSEIYIFSIITFTISIFTKVLYQVLDAMIFFLNNGKNY